MKRCTKCKITKPLTEFGINKTKRDGRATHCKSCRNTYLKTWYSDNQATHKERVNVSRRKLRFQKRLFVYEYLLEHPCIECGEHDPIYLDFDHVDRTTKAFGIGEAIRKSKSLEQIKEEINKCVIRCVKCHRKRTAKQFRWYQDLIKHRAAEVR